jgi:RHS repeat-associated protein
VFDSSGSTVLTPGLAQRSNGVNRFFQEDWIGSARYLTDSMGNTAPSALRYDAFGERTALAGPSYPTEFQFAGKWGYESEFQDGSDPGLEIDYLQARYYDPATGRFISRDPIGFKGGLNLYRYAEDNPVANVDPTGEDWENDLRVGMGFAGMVIGGTVGAVGGGAGGFVGGTLVAPGVGTVGGTAIGSVGGAIEVGIQGGILGLEGAELIIRGVRWLNSYRKKPSDQKLKTKPWLKDDRYNAGPHYDNDPGNIHGGPHVDMPIGKTGKNARYPMPGNKGGKGLQK